MYQHLVLFRFGQEVGEDVHRRIHDYAERIRTSLEGIVSYAYCRNLNAKSSDYPYAIVAAFDSVDSFAAYAAAPLHRRLVEFSMQYIDEVAIHDFAPGAGPVGSSAGDGTWQATRDRLKELMAAEDYATYYAAPGEGA